MQFDLLRSIGLGDSDIQGLNEVRRLIGEYDILTLTWSPAGKTYRKGLIPGRTATVFVR